MKGLDTKNNVKVNQPSTLLCLLFEALVTWGCF